MSAQSTKKKRIGSRRWVANQNKTSEAEDFHLTDSTVVQHSTPGGNTESLNILANPDYSKSETQNPASPELSHRKKLGSSRRNKREHGKDSATEPYDKPREEVEEKTRGNETPRKPQMCVTMEPQQQEELSPRTEDDMSARHDSSVYSPITPDYFSGVQYSTGSNIPETDQESLISKSQNLQANQDGHDADYKVVSDSCTLVETMLGGTHKSDTVQKEELTENAHLVGIPEVTSLNLPSGPTAEFIDQSSSTETAGDERYNLSSVTEKESKERHEGTYLLGQDGNFQGNDLESDSHVKSVVTEFSTTAEVTTDQSSPRTNTELECTVEQAIFSSPNEHLNLHQVNSAQHSECEQEFKPTEMYEISHSSVNSGNVVDQAELGDTHQSELTVKSQLDSDPDDEHDVRPTEANNFDTLKQTHDLYDSEIPQINLMSESHLRSEFSTESEITTDDSRTREHTEPECSTEQAMLSSPKDGFPKTEVESVHHLEDAVNKAHEPEVKPTQKHEMDLYSDHDEHERETDFKVEVSNKSVGAPLEEIDKTDTLQSESSLQTQQSETNASLDSQPQHDDTDFNSIGSRRKLGSTRRHKGRHRVKESESYLRPAEEVVESVSDSEALETTQMLVAIEKTTQEESSPESEHDVVVPATDDNSLYSAIMSDYSSEVQSSNTTNYAETDMESLIPKSENLQEDHDEEVKTTHELDHSSESVTQVATEDAEIISGNLTDQAEITDTYQFEFIMKDTDDSAAKQEDLNTDDTQDVHPTKENSIEASEQTNEDEDTEKLQISDPEREDSALGHVYEGEASVVEDDIKPSVHQEKEGLNSEVEESESSLQTQQSETNALLDSQPEQDDTDVNFIGSRRKLGSSRRNRGRRHAKDPVAESNDSPAEEIIDLSSESVTQVATEDAEIISGNLTDQAEITDTYQFEFIVKDTDDSAAKQQDLNTDATQDVHPTKENSIEASEQTNEDEDTEKLQISDPERVDSALGHVYEGEASVVEDDMKPSVHQEKEGILSGDEESESSLQTQQSETNAPLDSQPEQDDTDFNSIGSRRKLGSSRRNKGRHRVKESVAESYLRPTEEVVESVSDSEALETTQMLVAIEKTTQEESSPESCDGIVSATDDNSLYSAIMSDYSSEVQNSNTTNYPETDMESLIPKSENLQEDHDEEVKTTHELDHSSESVTQVATEDAEIISGNLTDQAEITDTYQFEFIVKDTDDSAAKQEDLNTDDTQDVHPTKENSIEASEQTNEDEDTEKLQISDPERVDSALGHVYEGEASVVEDDIKPNVEQTVHQEKEGILSGDEESESSLQTQQSEINASLDSQPQQDDTDFNSIGSRRKLGSSRRNKGRHRVKESVAESYLRPAEEVVESVSDSEALETTQMLVAIEKTTQEESSPESEHDVVVSATDDNSLYSAIMSDYSSEVQSSNTTNYPETDMESLIHKSENLQEDHDERQTDFKVEVSDKSVEGTLEEMDQSDILIVKSTDDSAAKQEDLNTDDTQDVHPTKENSIETSEQTNEDEDTEKLQISDTERVDSALGHVYESEASVVEDDVKPSVHQEKEGLNSEVEESESSLQTSETNAPLDSEPQQDDTDVNFIGSRRKLGSSRRNRGRRHAKDPVAESNDSPAEEIIDHSSESVTRVATEDAEIISGNLTDQAEITDTYQFEFIVKDTDDSAAKQEDLNTDDTQDVHPTKENSIEASEQTNEDEDTEKLQISDPERVDSALGHVYEGEASVVEDDIKPSVEQTVHQEKEGILSGDEESESSLQTQQSETNAPLDSQPEQDDTDFNSIGSRRKLGSSRRNKGRHRVKESVAESYLRPTEEVVESVSDSEAIETTQMLVAIEKTTQEESSPESCDGIVSATDDNSLYSAIMSDYSSEVQSSNTTNYPETDMESLIPKSENLQEDHDERQTDFKVEVSDKSVEGTLEEMDQSDILIVKSTDDSAAKQEDLNPVDTQDVHPTKENSTEASEQTNEDEDTEKLQISDPERVDSALGHVYEGEASVVEDGIKPNVHQEKEGLNSEVEESESSLQTSETNAPLDSEPEQDDTDLNFIGSRRKLGSSRRNRGRRHAKDPVAESNDSPAEEIVDHSSESVTQVATEDAEIISGNLTDHAEITDTYQFEFIVKSTDDSAAKQEDLNTDDTQDVHPTKENSIEASEQTNEDEDTEKLQISDPERVDSALGHVYESEASVVEDDIKPSVEQTVHQEKEGILSGDEESESSLQTQQSETNAPLDSQPQHDDTDFNSIGSRRKLGSTRRNKGRHRVKESVAESYLRPTEEVVESVSDSEAIETTQMLVAIEKTTQEESSPESCDGIVSATDDNSLYSAIMSDYSSEVQNSNTTNYPETDMESLIPKSENLQEDHDERETDFKVEVSDKSVEGTLEEMDQSDILIVKSTDDSAAKQEDLNPVDTQDVHPTKENSTEASEQTNEDEDTEKLQISDPERVDSALGHVYEGEASVVEDDIKPSVHQEKERLNSEVEEGESSLQTQQSETNALLDSQPEQDDTDVNFIGSRRKLGSSRRNRGRRHAKDPVAESNDSPAEEIIDHSSESVTQVATEDAEIISGNLTDQAEITDTYQFEMIVKSTDDSAAKQEDLNTDDTQDVHPTKENSIEASEQTNEDEDTEKLQISDPERVDSALGHVYESEASVVEDDIKPNVEQTVHQEKEGLNSEVEESESSLQIQQSGTNAYLDSQPEQDDANFNPVGSRRKLGSSRRNRGRRHAKDPVAESNDSPAEEIGGNIRDNAQTEGISDQVKENEHVGALIHVSEFMSSSVHPSLTVDQQVIDPSTSKEMQEQDLSSVYFVKEKESKDGDENTDLLRQDGNSQGSYLVSESHLKLSNIESSTIPEISIEKSRTGEHVDTEYVKQGAVSSPEVESSTNEEQKHVNFSQVRGSLPSENVLNEVTEEVVKPTQMQEMHQVDFSSVNESLQSETNALSNSQDNSQDSSVRMEEETDFNPTGNRRKLGSSRRNKGRQQVEVSVAKTYHEPKDEFGDEALETTKMLLARDTTGQEFKQQTNLDLKPVNYEENTEKMLEDTIFSQNVMDNSTTTDITSTSGKDDSVRPNKEVKEHENFSQCTEKNTVKIDLMQSPEDDSCVQNMSNHDDSVTTRPVNTDVLEQEEAYLVQNREALSCDKDSWKQIDEASSLDVFRQDEVGENYEDPTKKVHEAQEMNISQGITHDELFSAAQTNIGTLAPFDIGLNENRAETAVSCDQQQGIQDKTDLDNSENTHGKSKQKKRKMGSTRRTHPHRQPEEGMGNEDENKESDSNVVEMKFDKMEVVVTADVHHNPNTRQGTNVISTVEDLALTVLPPVDPTKENSFEALEQTDEEQQISGIESVDTELGQVYVIEGQVGDDIKASAEQTVLQEKEGIFSEVEESDSSLQTLQSGTNATLDSQPEQSDTNFKPIGSRRKLGSSRRNKGRKHAKDSEQQGTNEISTVQHLALPPEQSTVDVEPSQLDDFTSTGMHVPTLLARERTTNIGITGESFVSSHETTQNDEERPESVNLIQDQALKSAEAPVVADLEMMKSIVRGGAEDVEHKDDKANIQELNDVNEGAHDTNLEMKNSSPNLNSPARRRKLGSTRRNLGSRSKREDLHQQQEVENEEIETVTNVGDVKSASFQNIEEKEELQPLTEDKEIDLEQRKEKVFETAEYSHAFESHVKPPPHQEIEENPVSHVQPVETDYHLTPRDLSAIPSTSPTAGGRRRKLGSSRKTRGHQSEREDRIADTQNMRDVTSITEESDIKTTEEDSPGLDKISEVEGSDEKPPSNISASEAEEQSRPVSEKTPQQATPVPSTSAEIRLSQEGQKPFSLAGSPRGAALNSNSYNVMMVGDSSVGKSSFMKRAQSGKFSLDLPASVGLDSCTWTVVVDGKRVVLQLWDTAGQERFHSITRQIFHKAQAFLLLYDITSTQSFTAVNYWASCIQEGAAENVTILLLGNKNDKAERKVKTEEGAKLARECNFEFMECSAATGENVIHSLETVARILSQKVGTREETTVLQKEPKQKKSGCC